MDRLYTMELRVDFKDDMKRATMERAFRQAARHINATAALLADHIKPQMIVFYHDYMAGHKELNLLETSDGPMPVLADAEDPGVSEELLEAMKG